MSGPRPWVWAAAALVAGVALVVAVAVVVMSPQRTAATADGVVESNGVHLEVGGIRVDAPGGVAAVGTTLSGAVASTPSSTAAGALPGPTGSGIELRFSDGSQPARPVTITFPSTTPYTVDQPSKITGVDDVAPFVLAEPSHGGTSRLVPARYDAATRTVTTQVTHFTSFWEKPAKARDMLADVVKNLAGATPKPDCVGKPATLASGRTLSLNGPGHDTAWVCVRAQSDSYFVDLKNNSPEPWKILASPRATLQPQVETELANILAIGVAKYTNAGLANAPGVLTTRGSATYRFPADALPAEIRLSADPGTLLISQIAFAVQIVGDVFGIDLIHEALKIPEAISCLGKSAESAGDRSLNAETVGNTLRTLLGCFGTVAETMGLGSSPIADIVIAIVGTGLGLVVAGIVGIVDTIVGPYRISITQDSGGGGGGGGYRRYVNARFGFSVTIPVELTTTTDPANGDGLELTSADKRTRLTVSAGYRLDNADAAALLADQSDQVTRGGGRISYSTHNTDSFTLSGLDSSGNVFYQHSSIGPRTIATAYWLYPKTDLARWKLAVETTTTTLKAGAG